MFNFWDTELTPEETETLLDKAAAEVKKRKMEAPVAVFLETHMPLAFVGSQAAIALSPFMVPFFGFEFMNNYSRLFSSKDNIAKLLDKLTPPPADQLAKKEDACAT